MSNLDNKSDAVVNILDEILEDDLEDLGGEESATKKGGRSRSQRFPPENPTEDGNVDDEPTGTNMIRKSKRGTTTRQATNRTSSGSSEPVATRALRRKNPEPCIGIEPASKKNALNEMTSNESTSVGGKETNSNGNESTASTGGNEVKGKAEPTDNKGEDTTKAAVEQGSSKSKNDEDTRKEDDAAANAQDDHYESGSDVSSSDDDEHSQISNPSFSSASFGSDSGAKDSRTSETEKKSSSPSGNESKLKQQKKDYSSRLSYILRDARFFLMKSNNGENVDLSKSKNVWATPPANESKINQALKEARNVLLIFSVKESGKFSGFARLASESSRSGQSVNWILPPGLSRGALGGLFHIDWISKNDVLFNKTQHLFNPWNEGKPVKIGRDGQEIEPHVASELCRLFAMDTTTDWNAVLKRSKEAAKKVNHTKVVSPIGSNSALGSRTGSRGRGFRDRRDTRGRLSTYLRNGRHVFGRGMRRRVNEDDYSQRPKRSRGSYDYHYKGTYTDRGSDMNTNHRYSRDRSYPSPRKSSHVYPDYVVRDYHHRPPPMAPLPYPPPPPFDSLPPPPRYYDGPPLPEFPPPARTSSRDHRSASPVRYEKSVTEFLRRTSDRRERERVRERERDRDRKYRR